MKKIFGSAIVVLLLAACQGTGDREHTMQTNETEPPTNSVNNNPNPYDSSTQGVQDSSTTMAHDTGAVRKN